MHPLSFHVDRQVGAADVAPRPARPVRRRGAPETLVIRPEPHHVALAARQPPVHLAPVPPAMPVPDPVRDPRFAPLPRRRPGPLGRAIRRLLRLFPRQTGPAA